MTDELENPLWLRLWHGAQALLFLGLSRQLWGTTPLPLSLNFMGAGGCNLHVSADVVLGMKTGAGGAISFAAPVPSNETMAIRLFW